MSTRRRLSAALGLGIALSLAPLPGAAPGHAADPEVSKEVIAVQIRKQGFECKNPESAERDKDASKPDETVWLLTCEGARYKVQLIPKMAAKVERLPDAQEEPAAAPEPPATEGETP